MERGTKDNHNKQQHQNEEADPSEVKLTHD
jgi:hypothetical protein